MKLDRQTAHNLHEYRKGHVTVVAQRDNYLVLQVEPLSEHHHRESSSWLFASFPDPSAGAAAMGKLPAGLDAVLRDAVAAVADPDLGLGDFDVDTWGDVDRLPAVIQLRLQLTRDQDFRMAWRGVAPRDLSDATMAWLASTPPPLPASVPPTEASPQYFRLMHFERDLGVVDCNGMKWRNAIVAVLRDGLLGEPMTEAQAADLLDEIGIVRLPEDYRPTGAEVKAQRRARGTAPTGAMTRVRYHGLLDALKAKPADYPLPALDKDAKKVVEAMSAEYHRLKAAGALKPTERQLDLARRIADTLQIDLPFDPGVASRQEVSAFIEQQVEPARRAGRPGTAR